MRIGKTAALASLRTLMEVEAPVPEDRLPTERRLADMIGCSRETLRTALATLSRKEISGAMLGKAHFGGVHQ